MGSYPGVGVDGTAVDVEVVLGQDLGALVDGTSRTIENSTQHVLGNGNLQVLSCELHGRLSHVHSSCTLKDLHTKSVGGCCCQIPFFFRTNLDDGSAASHFEDLSGALGAIGKSQVDDLPLSQRY